MKIILTIFLVLSAVLSLYTQVDSNALEIYDESFDRAVYSFALVKGLNAIISVIQSTEINLSLFVGATVGIGQVLDPINDLVERFSVVMLVASVSIGVQHLLLLLGKSIFLKILLFASVSFTLLSIWVKKLDNAFIFFFSLRLVLLFLVLRFAAVVFIYTTEFIYEEVYAEQYQKSNTYIQTYKDELEVLQQNKTQMDGLWLELKNKTEKFSKKVIELITIFVVTTIVFPLLYIWLLVFLIKVIFNIKFDYDIISQNFKINKERI